MLCSPNRLAVRFSISSVGIILRKHPFDAFPSTLTLSPHRIFREWTFAQRSYHQEMIPWSCITRRTDIRKHELLMMSTRTLQIRECVQAQVIIENDCVNCCPTTSK
jgi:hypothetical protein